MAGFTCNECCDSGVKRYSTGWGLSDWVEVECPRCLRPVDEHDDGECPPPALLLSMVAPVAVKDAA